MSSVEYYTKSQRRRMINVTNMQLPVIMRHAAWWLFFISYELSIYLFTEGRIDHLFRTFIYYICNICLFYSQKYLLDLFLSSAEKYSHLILAIAAEIIVYLMIKITADYLFTDFTKSTVPKFEELKEMAALDLYRCIFFAALATLYWTGLNISRFQRKAAEAEIRQLTAERNNLILESNLAKAQNAYLQQQINPHLLFNSLNFIHNTVYRYSEAAAENVLLLAEIMRFTLEDTGPDGKVSLRRETEQMSNLIAINRSRFDYPLAIDLSVSGDTGECRIIPLVLMTLLENIFKHANLRERPAYALLRVSELGQLYFETGNFKSSSAPAERIRSLGIRNIRLRLNYAYGDRYQLNITESDDYYKSDLTIQL